MRFPGLHLLLLAAINAGIGAALAIAESARSLPCASSSFHLEATADYSITSITAKAQHNYTTPYTPGLDFCDVYVHLSHYGANDDVSIRIWLPLVATAWNGRYEATGGSGWATGDFETLTGIALYGGFATATTDGGHHNDYSDVSWALKADKTINWPLMFEFATFSIANMVVVGKTIVQQYYGTPPHHSYFAGCSTGGRQGYMLAQQYPGIVDGILANAPGLSMAHGAMGLYWPQLAMQETDTLMSRCEFEYFENKVLEKCDILDGANDSVIANPEDCSFDPQSLVGDKIKCDGNEVVVTKAMADIVQKIEEGPTTPYGAAIWHGYPYGVDTSILANVTVNPDGQRTQAPFGISSSYIQNLLVKDPTFNVSTLSYSDYVALFSEGSHQFGWLLNADSPNLSAFQKAGGKLLTWHGTSDNVLPYHNTVHYRTHVEQQMGGTVAVDQFYRLFLAPGVEHCLGGFGAQPTNPIGQLVEWVENGVAPETMDAATYNAAGQLVTRDLCKWPAKTKYMGIGDPNRASSWTCEGSEDNEEDVVEKLDSRAGEILGGLTDRLMGLGMGLRFG